MIPRGEAIEILRRIRQIGGGHGAALMYRGESQWFEEVSSRVWRDHRKAGIDMADLTFDDIEEKIAHDVRKFTEMPERSTREVIDELEVAGGKTNQINFTYDSGVAVWFACQEPREEDGRVIMVKKNSVESRFVRRDYAPRQMPVLVSNKEGRIPEEAIVAVERIPSALKGDLLSVLAKQCGLWTETVFSGAIQTAMGYARLQGDTSDITKARSSELVEERRMLKGFNEALRNIEKQKRQGNAVAERQRAREPENGSNTIVVIRAVDGIRQSDLDGLNGNLWMNSGVLYSLRLNADSQEVAAKLGQIEEGSKGLVQLRMSGLRTDRTWEVTVGEITEIELISWDLQTSCTIELEFQLKRVEPVYSR